MPRGQATTTILRAPLLALAVVCLLLPACNSFRITSPFIPAGPKVAQETAPPLPSKHHYRIAGFIFASDFELNYDQPLFNELGVLGELIRRELTLPTCDQPVLVYLFEDRDKYERYTQARYPEVPRRRAFFVAQPKLGGGEDLLAFTYWGDKIRVDLRHELTHAVLHGVLKDVPLWLDEGLAEYFEVEPGGEGVNPQHLEFFRQIGPRNFEPDLARLEQLNQLQQMTPREYREAWAWVHLMLRTDSDTKLVLTEYLKQLRTNPNPGPLQPRLARVLPNAPASLRRHLADVDRQQSAARPLPQRN
jgi:Protein of unknown function (DUF1570)